MYETVKTTDKYSVLKKYFGYDSFRYGQERIVDDMLNGEDVLAVMPTGAGKSLCFQVPSLLSEGTAIVISPLISLMKDQIYALKENGIPAEAINSSSDPIERQEIYEAAYNGKYKLLYISPERLDTAEFLRLASSIKISYVCIDEAHCVSQWGQDFRSSYLKIAEFINSFKVRPTVAAFTATATHTVRDDIIRLLELKSPDIVVTGFDRENLYFEVRDTKDKLSFVESYLGANSEKSGIIYCSTRKTVEQLFHCLKADGYSVTKYHAGLDADERRHNQDNFVRDDLKVMIATNAFGMGIDKSNVSFVIHYNMPGDIESYYQEAGRAGRDGEKAECILLYAKKDIVTQRFFINNPAENEGLTDFEIEMLRKRKSKKLNQMIDYCESNSCLRNYILSYFGEVRVDDCKNCSVCCGKKEYADITVEAQKILSAVARTNETLEVGKIVDLLLATSYAENDPYLSSIKTFGAMKGSTQEDTVKIIMYLVRKNYVDVKSGVLKLNDFSKDILFRSMKVLMPYLETEKVPKKEKVLPKQSKDTSLTAQDEELFDILKKLRKELADKKNVPAFVIFSDATLRSICIEKPTDISEFLAIKGVGAKKAESYGPAFTKAVNLYLKQRKM